MEYSRDIYTLTRIYGWPTKCILYIILLLADKDETLNARNHMHRVASEAIPPADVIGSVINTNIQKSVGRSAGTDNGERTLWN